MRDEDGRVRVEGIHHREEDETWISYRGELLEPIRQLVENV
jgi:hypothetical protein